MKFQKYQHVCRYGTQETNGIEDGRVFVFPKFDGSNASVWMEDGQICAGSRNRKLGLGKEDNQGFYGWVLENENIKQYLTKHPTHRLFMEWMKPHSLKTYEDNVWGQAFVFDVCIDNGHNVEDGELEYLSYFEYSPYLEEFNIPYLPVLEIFNNPTIAELKECVEDNNYLIKDDEGRGEGIVIKRYDFKNKYGRTVWAKILHEEFTNRGNKKNPNKPVDDGFLERDIVANYVTSHFVEKEYAKIINEDEDMPRKKLIPMLLSKVWYELINEEMYNVVKKYRSPVIDFKKLNMFVINKVKEIKVDLFV